MRILKTANFNSTFKYPAPSPKSHIDFKKSNFWSKLGAEADQELLCKGRANKILTITFEIKFHIDIHEIDFIQLYC